MFLCLIKGRCLALICTNRVEYPKRLGQVSTIEIAVALFSRGKAAAAKRPHQRQEGKETIISPPATSMAATHALHEILSDERKAVSRPLHIEIAMRQRFDVGSLVL